MTDRSNRHVPGLTLSARFYAEIIRPILDEYFPYLYHSAALIGSGSDVLGFDTEMSEDHDWGPRLTLFLAEAQFSLAESIAQRLRSNLPASFLGYSTHFKPIQADGSRLLSLGQAGEINHFVEISTSRAFFQRYLGIDPTQEIDNLTWLTLEEQRLLTITSGKVFFDGLNELEPARLKLSYYPHPIWLYLLSAQWAKIGQEEPFVGRCGSVGDEIGSRLIAARLVQAVMRLCFLMDKQYAPYSKWFGTAFSRLECAAEFSPIFTQVLIAPDWQERQRTLGCAFNLAAAWHNRLGITASLPELTSSFHGRPFQVIHGEEFSAAITAFIDDEQVKALPPAVGSVNQFLDSVDVLSDVHLCQRLKNLYTG